jgi:hypothetical protein
MVHKPFSPDLYAKNDDAKQLIIDWLNTDDEQHAYVNPDQYGIDIICDTADEHRFFYEVEVKHNWKGATFPFSTVHFPKRKLKFANEDSFFAMLNHERTHVLIISGQQFLTAPIVRKDTIYTKNEEFIEITISDCKIYELGAVNE